MLAKKLRWGILGTAQINEKILPHLRTSERSVPEAVASRDPERASAYARSHGISRAIPSYAALVEDPNIDIVYISLPNHLHYEWAKAALENRKHVLCEKPLSLSGQEVATLAEIAEEKGLSLSEGFMYRHHAQTKRVLDLLDPSSERSAGLGKIRRIHASFHIIPAAGPNVRTTSNAGAGALYDVGCYLVDYCLAIAGRAPRDAFAVAKFHSVGYDEFFAGTLVFENDFVAQIDCGFLGPRIDRIDVLCEKGWVRIPHPFKPGPVETIAIHRRENRESVESVETIEITDPNDPYFSEIQDFESAVIDQRAPHITAKECIATSSTLELLMSRARGFSVPPPS